MNAQHTAGPWTIGTTKQGIPGTIRDGLSRVVAFLPREGDVGYPHGEDLRAGSPYTPEGITANARLIAAAPDLLMAAQLSLRLLDYLAAEQKGRGEDWIARVPLRAAIEKAVGLEVPA